MTWGDQAEPYCVEAFFVVQLVEDLLRPWFIVARGVSGCLLEGQEVGATLTGLLQ